MTAMSYFCMPLLRSRGPFKITSGLIFPASNFLSAKAVVAATDPGKGKPKAATCAS